MKEKVRNYNLSGHGLEKNAAGAEKQPTRLSITRMHNRWVDSKINVSTLMKNIEKILNHLTFQCTAQFDRKTCMLQGSILLSIFLEKIF